MYARNHSGAMALKDVLVLYPFRRCDMSPPPITGPEFHEVVHLTGVLGYDAGLCVRFNVFSTAEERHGGDGKRIRTGFHRKWFTLVFRLWATMIERNARNAEAFGVGNDVVTTGAKKFERRESFLLGQAADAGLGQALEFAYPLLFWGPNVLILACRPGL